MINRPLRSVFLVFILNRFFKEYSIFTNIFLKTFSGSWNYDIMKKFTNSIYKEIQMGESNFVLKVEAACQKKEELYTASKAR